MSTEGDTEVTEKKANGIGPGSMDVDGEMLGTFTFEMDGTRHTVRELTVDEGDDAWEAAKGPDGKVNDRLNTRMLLSKAMVSPTTSAEAIGKFGNRKYQMVLREFNKLNSLPLTNPTLPAGSAGLTSPDGGEPSPTL